MESVASDVVPHPLDATSITAGDQTTTLIGGKLENIEIILSGSP